MEFGLTFHILGRILLTDYYFSEGFKPPTRERYIYIYLQLDIMRYIGILIFMNGI